VTKTVNVKKRDGRNEGLIEAKIVAGVKKAGATAEEAARVGKEVAEKVAHRGEVAAEELSTMVVTSLAKVNKKASEEFVKFRDAKLKTKKQKAPTK
jgi:transcriptional regulator NrdR family protein